MTIDLHCHSNVSDGLLTPRDLVRTAADAGVRLLALTDHDDTAGLTEAADAAQEAGIRLVRGTEISVTWRQRTLHMVGLNIDPEYPPLKNGLAVLRAGRGELASRIAQALAAAGIDGALEGARRHAGNPDLISRSHFARFLVDAGHARDVKSVFRKYLTAGKPGHVRHVWADLADAIAWVHGSGGQAVLAHPGRYDMGPVTMRELLGEFRDLGGDGIEVVTGSHRPDQFEQYAALACEFGLLASCGSDWHGPGESWMALGRLPPLPARVTPIWRDWPDMAA